MGVGVLISGNGSNLRAIIESGIKVDFVGTNNPEARGLEIARENNIPYIVQTDPYTLETAIYPIEINLLVCAGYMRILSSNFVQEYKKTIINIHPSLLPAFPGLNAVQQALDYGVKVTGVTIHEVDEGVDTGPIIAQNAIEVRKDDTVESLTYAIQQVEHYFYPQVIKELLYEIK